MIASRYPPRDDIHAVSTASDVAFPGGEAPLPLVCRWPKDEAPKAFVIFCHGLGASGRDYARLSTRWAANGYLVIHPTFPDWVGAVLAAEPGLGVDPSENLDGWTSDPRLKPRLYEILHTPAYWLERVRIVRAVLDGLGLIMEATCGAPPAAIPGAIAGHSFGAYTSQLFAGAEIDVPGEGARSFRDERVAAAILLSAQGLDQQGLRAGSWDGITGPMLNVTGTRDGGAKGQDWHWKVQPYELAPPGDKYLAVLTDADHYLGGVARPGQFPVPVQHEAVAELTLAFLDAYLGGSVEAGTWLDSIDDRIGDCPVLFKRK